MNDCCPAEAGTWHCRVRVMGGGEQLDGWTSFFSALGSPFKDDTAVFFVVVFVLFGSLKSPKGLHWKRKSLTV